MRSIEQYAKEYAKLVIESGVVLRNGQSVHIRTGYDNYQFARLLAQTAYRSGALHVVIDIDDPQLTKTKIESQSIEELTIFPDYQKQIDYEMMAKDWAFIRIDNTEDRHWLEDVDASKLSAMRKAASKWGAIYRQSRMRHEHPWCVICVPGPVWAKKVLGEQATVELLWETVAPILRLDTYDPSLAWKEHANMLDMRSKRLNSLNISSLHFTAKETDLTIGFRKEHLWVGGGDPLPNGTWFLPNIPTEEVFSVPDMHTAEGIVRTTRPVSVMDSLVEDVVLEFNSGRVVSCTARVGQKVMDNFLAIDEGATRLGEVALVDENSPIARSKKVFGSILYDENASCHLALGAGYPSCLSNSASLTTDEQLKQAGCNTSLTHTDFMIGSADMDIVAHTREGKKVVIMKDGQFTI